VVSDGTEALSVKVNPISMGLLNQGAFEAGPDVVAGTVYLESGIRLRSHVVPWTSRKRIATTQFILHVVVVVHTTVLLLPEISELAVFFLFYAE